VCYFVCRIVLAQVKVRGHARLKTAMSFWFYKGEGFLDHLSDCHRSGCILLCVIRETSALALRATDCVKKDKDSTGM